MRILQIRFKNLNSLAGEWQIDLTDPAYISDGIFAITGPTGAGKSTLLDAICLALYGRTPRQSRVNASQNEVMSRQTGECFAEVLFETPQGRWRCHWSQHRSRKQADGALQQPKHEIVDADADKVLHTKLKDVADTIERLTGMDFDRFTRSMLLAQGGFAAFLQADADARAPILEQITGTSIYSDISVAVHRRRGEERQRLDHLKAAQSGLQLLDEEEEATLSRQLAELSEQVQQQSNVIGQQQTLLNWRQQLDRESRQAAQLKQQWHELEQAQQAFAPQQQQLEQALRAEALRPAYEPLRQRRGDLQRAQEQLDPLQAGLPALQDAADAALARQQQAQAHLQQAEAELERQQPLLRKLQEQDWKLREQQAQVAQLSARLPAELLEGSAPDPATLEAAIERDEQALQAALAGSTRAQIQQQQDQIRSRGEQLGELRTRVQQADELKQAQQEAAHKRAALKPEQDRIQQSLEQQQAEESRLQQEQLDLQKLQRLAERIADLEQQRHELEPGKPCPLCGSEQHPWRSEQPPQLTEEKARLQRLEQQLTALRSELQALAVQQARLEQDEKGLHQQEADNSQRLEALQPPIQHCLQLLALDTCPAPDEIEQVQQAARQQWGELCDRLAEIDRLEQALKQQRAEQERVQQRLALDAARADLTQLQQQRQALSPEPDTAAFEQRLQQAIRQARQAQEQAQAAAIEQQNSLNRRQQQISDLKRHMTDLNTEMAQMQQAFDAALAQSQFADEQTLQAALLPEASLKTLQQAADRLKADAARLQALQEQCQSSLQLLQQQALTEQSSAELAAALEQLTSEHGLLLEKRGSLQQTLNINTERKAQFGAQQQAIDAQQRELERWDTLHALIGSADGKKFRNFAQGLTFELMIGHANRQLQKMSDRYLLVRDAEQPLELNVIDNYQAGEIRSTKNLSGGESFLISLALALGLSGMASRNVRVDSLFLDEGFGTLDEEALETALDTLSGLQQEGKLIGVISHVQALKDRIATRIEVQPISGGRSRISGPGCSALTG